jgi:hypothetical protein
LADVAPDLALQTIGSLTTLEALQANSRIKATLTAKIKQAATAAGKDKT